MWCPAQKFAYRIRSAARFFPVLRRHLIGKGIRHFGSPDSAHVMRSDYQIRCSKRVQIIKFDTRYRIKRMTKLLKYMNPVLVFECSVTQLLAIAVIKLLRHGERPFGGPSPSLAAGLLQ